MTHTHHMKVRFYCLTKRGNARNISFVKNGGNITLINLLGTKFWWIRIPSANPNEFFSWTAWSHYNKIVFSFSLLRYVLVEFLVILMYFTCLQYLTTGLPNLKIKAIYLWHSAVIWSIKLVHLTVVTAFFLLTRDIWRDTMESRCTKSKNE